MFFPRSRTTSLHAEYCTAGWTVRCSETYCLPSRLSERTPWSGSASKSRPWTSTVHRSRQPWLSVSLDAAVPAIVRRRYNMLLSPDSRTHRARPISMLILRLCHHSRPSDCTTSYAGWSIARVHRNLPRRPAPASRTHGTQAAEAGRTSRRGLSLRRWQPNHSSLEVRVLQDNMS